MKRSLKIFGVLLVLLVGGAGYFHYVVARMPLPWKVTDPHDPRFVEENFRFEDYYGRDGSKRLQEALRVMFPIGTPKAKVDRILYENQPKFTDKTKWGGSMKQTRNYPRKKSERNIYHYYYTPYPHALNIFVVSVFYDSDNLVKEVTDHGEALHNKNFYEEN
jgi:hypothetical protein